MNNRRKVLIALGAGMLAAPLASFAQQQQRIFRVGVLSTDLPDDKRVKAFTQALHELGYVEGKNVLLERRFASGDFARVPALAADLVQQRLDVIFATNAPAVAATQPLTSTIPIVFANVADPVGGGFVASFAHPGANITGISIISPELSAKRLQLLKELFPKTSRVAVFVSDEPSVAVQFAEMQRAAKALAIDVQSAHLRRRDDVEQTRGLLRKWRADSIYVMESPTNYFNRKLLTEFAELTRLPAVFGNEEYANAGGLLSYGASYEFNWRRAANYVDKILKGTKPSDLPVELPTKFELVINLKTAKALGITIPQSILMRADRVIE